MKKEFKPLHVFAATLLLGCAFGFTACSDDVNNNLPNPDEVTTDAMFGSYTGQMTIQELQAAASATAEGEGEGTSVSARIDNDTVYFDSFPIEDIVLAIVGDETTAGQIVEAVGDVSYKMAYEPTLTAEKDSILFDLKPEALKLSVNLSADETEAAALQIEVKLEADAQGGYDVESGSLGFGFNVTEVLLGEGEEQTPLPNFAAKSLQFDMDKTSAE